MVVFLTLEIAFRLIIPASNPPHAYFDSDEEIFKFDVKGPRTGINTIGHLAQLRAGWHVNNLGWISEVDYKRERTEKPLIAIIGDSFLVALQVETEDSLPSLVRNRIGDTFDVYSFAVSGAPLSQYLHLSRYVSEHFNPDILVFNMIHNDFDESLCDVRQNIGMLCLHVDDEEGISESDIIPYTPSKFRRWARKSSLVRYLVLNRTLWSARLDRTISESEDITKTSVENGSFILKHHQIELASDYALDRIAAENPDKSVIIMIDGPRSDIYKGNTQAEDDFTNWQHQFLKKTTKRHQFEFIDLSHPFARQFAQDRVAFDSPHDYHWNENGHDVAAEALIHTIQRMNTK